MHKIIIRNETVFRFLRLEMEFYWNRIKHFTYLQLLCAYDDVIAYESYLDVIINGQPSPKTSFLRSVTDWGCNRKLCHFDRKWWAWNEKMKADWFMTPISWLISTYAIDDSFNVDSVMSWCHAVKWHCYWSLFFRCRHNDVIYMTSFSILSWLYHRRSIFCWDWVYCKGNMACHILHNIRVGPGPVF